MSKIALTEADYLAIEKKCDIKDSEHYAVTYSKVRTKMVRTVHVFERKPDTREMTRYENEASKLTLRGKKAEIEGGAIGASAALYKVLISRVFDLVEGRQIVEGPIPAQQANSRVDPLTKRAALRDLLGEVYSASQIADQEGEDSDKGGSTLREDGE